MTSIESLITEALDVYEVQTDEIARRARAIFDDTAPPIEWRDSPEFEPATYYSQYADFLARQRAGQIDWASAARRLGLPEEFLIDHSLGFHWTDVTPGPMPTELFWQTYESLPVEIPVPEYTPTPRGRISFYRLDHRGNPDPPFRLVADESES